MNIGILTKLVAGNHGQFFVHLKPDRWRTFLGLVLFSFNYEINKYKSNLSMLAFNVSFLIFLLIHIRVHPEELLQLLILKKTPINQVTSEPIWIVVIVEGIRVWNCGGRNYNSQKWPNKCLNENSDMGYCERDDCQWTHISYWYFSNLLSWW